jgi:ferritin
MLKENIYTLINDQINHELYSSYLYLSMATYFESANLPGFAHWMQVQSTEEREHAMKFYEYVFDRGEKVTLKTIEQPPSEWESPLDVFEHVLRHEQKVTSLINTIYAVALAENDYATQVMLQWFITEQVEEEKNATQIIEQLKMIENKETANILIDHALRKRGGD